MSQLEPAARARALSPNIDSPERRANLTGSDGKAAGHCMGRAEATGWHSDVRVVAQEKVLVPAGGRLQKTRDGLLVCRLVMSIKK